MRQQTISVIVPVYNAEKTIIACIKSLISQTYPLKEIIMVDNCSKDNSYVLIKNFIKEHSLKNVKLLKEEKKGPGAARNCGVYNTDSELIAFTDSDCRAPTDWVEKIVKVFGSDHDVDIIAGTAQGLEQKTYVNKLMFLLRNRANTMSKILEYNENTAFRGPIFATMNFAIKRKVFCKLKGFNEEYELCAEDVHFCLTALKNNFSLKYYPHIFIYHHERDTIKGIFKQCFNYRMEDARILKNFFPKVFVLNISRLFFFRTKIWFGSVWVDKLPWLLLLCVPLGILVFINSIFAIPAYFLTFLLSGFWYVNKLAKDAELRISYFEIPIIFFCYCVKQLGDLSGRITGSIKYRVVFL